MATPTPVIMGPANSGQAGNIFAGLTAVQFSAMDSWLNTSSPSDFWNSIARCTWDFGDSTPIVRGGHVQHTYSTPGTKTVTLTVYSKDGTSASTTVNVVVAATPSFTFVKYVAGVADGGNDLNSGNDSAHPYATLERAFSDWRNTGFASWGLIAVKVGTTLVYAGLNDATHSPDPRFGPLWLTTYGSPWVPPTINVGATTLFIGADATLNHPVLFGGMNFTGTSLASSALFQMWQPGIQFSGCVFNHVMMEFRSKLGSIQYGSINGGRRYSLFLSGTNGFTENWQQFDQVTFAGSGSDPVLDHQIYASSGVNYAGFTDCVSDGTGATCDSGFKTSGCRKLWIGNHRSKACINGFDVGANVDDREGQDVVYDNPIVDSCTGWGFTANWIRRLSIRNARSIGGCGQSFFEEKSWNSGQIAQDFEIISPSTYMVSGHVLNFRSSWFLNAKHENGAHRKSTFGGDQSPFQCLASGDLAKITNTNNLWIVDGKVATDLGMFIIGAADVSFSTWQTTYGKDVTGKWADPLWNDPANGDFALKFGSPCKDAGIIVGNVDYDAAGVLRPQGGAYDLGALETGFTSGNGLWTFRQYPSTFVTDVNQIAFESFAAADGAVRQAIADNPRCQYSPESGPPIDQPWVYPGTDDGLVWHLFVRQFSRWERGAGLWYVQGGRDDGTEAHETAIPGYAFAVGYDTALDSIRAKYVGDVDDVTVASKISHYDIVHRVKEKRDAPGVATLNVIYSESAAVDLQPRSGAFNIPLQPIWSESAVANPTPTRSVVTDLTTVFSESGAGFVIPGGGASPHVPLGTIWSRLGVFVELVPIVNRRLNAPLAPPIFSESATLPLAVKKGPVLNAPLDPPIFSNSITNDVDATIATQTLNRNIGTIFSESATQPVAVQSGLFRFVQLDPCWSETWAGFLDANVVGVQLNAALFPTFSESYVDTVGSSTSVDRRNVPLDTGFSESFTVDPQALVTQANMIEVQSTWSESACLDVTGTLVARPLAVVVGTVAGSVELEEDIP